VSGAVQAHEPSHYADAMFFALTVLLGS
jgi:hypothetical protein